MQRILLLALLALPLALVCTASAQNPGSSSSKSKHKAEPRGKPRSTPPVSDTAVAYRNPEFDFSYKTPYGWVDRTREMQDESSDPAKSRLLLAIFERPPQVTGDSVNSAVIITAENAASYPGLKTAADYMGPLTELTASKGFKVTQPPYQFPLGTKLLVRGDFAKQIARITMYQSSLVTLHKSFIVSFTFIGGSADELEELIEKLSFGAAPGK